MPASAPASPAAATSAGFSSAPINPVMTHSRRHKSDGAWPSDSQNQQNEDNSSGSGTPDEDIRSKSRPSSADSQTKKEDAGNQNQTLPSLSSGGAALLQLREHQRAPSSSNNNSPRSNNNTAGNNADRSKLPPQSGAPRSNQMPAFRRSVSGSREEGNPLIPDEDMNEEDDEELDDVDDEDPSAPPSPTDRAMKVMFHGREIFAEDLIGLRVAKTFARHGRFLGQVVKFDKRASLYTVVYADGDAEDLTVDATLQILIQDEIERADPAQPPPAISLLFKKSEDGSSPASPDAGDFMVPPPAVRQPSAPQRRSRIQVSEREAQFVISLFENHALPSLVRQGWRVQRSNSGRGETRFLSPTEEIFPSALDVVGYIASDNQLLTACFPANVHSAILSLLPPEAQPGTASATETGSNHGSTSSALRKRTTSDSPSAQQLDGKRTRPTREEAYVLPVRAGAVRNGDTALYRPEDMDRRAEAASRIPAYRGQGMGGRIRMSGDRFVGGETTSDVRIQAPPEVRGYRRAPSRDPTLENPFTSRWPGGDPTPGRIDPEYARRFADSPGWRERAEPYVPDRPLESHSRNRIRGEGRYIHRMSAWNPADPVDGGAVMSGSLNGYYRDSVSSSPGGEASPMTNSGAYAQYRARSGEYRSSEMANRITSAPRVSRETASFMSPTDTLGASAAFSMVDVDRISKSRPGSAHAEQQPRGRSPRQGEGQTSYLQHQSTQHHRRTSSGHSYHGQRTSEGHYASEPTSESQGEQRGSATSGTSGASSQQQQHE